MIKHLKDVFHRGRNPSPYEKEIWTCIENVPCHMDLEIADLQEPHFSRIMSELTDEKENENFIYRRDPMRSENLLALCKLANDDRTGALEVIEGILQHDNNNVVALVNKILIHRLSSMPSALRAPLHKLNELKVSTEWQLLELKAKSELAFCNSRFTPYHFTKAIKQYESVFDQYESVTDLPTCTEFKNMFLLWKYDLSVLYNRMLNKGYSVVPVQIDFDKEYGKIHKLLACVIDSRDEQLTGRAYVELGDAFRKCETNKGCRSSMKLPWNLTVKKCMEEAYKSSPDDTYVLERLGRYLRHMARKPEDFHHAIEILEKSSKKCPLARHVAIHQQALAFKSLWHIEENMPEKEVFDNRLLTRFSKSKQPSKRNKHKRRKHKHNNIAECDLSAASNTLDSGCEQANMNMNTCESMNEDPNIQCSIESIDVPDECSKQSHVNRMQTHDNSIQSHQRKQPHNKSQLKDTHDINIQSCDKSMRSHDNSIHSHVNSIQSNEDSIQSHGCAIADEADEIVPLSKHIPVVPQHKTVFPKLPEEKKMEHHKKLRFDKLKVMNSRTRKPPHCPSIYLSNAKELMVNVNQITNYTMARYLVDLARIHISLNEDECALECFNKAIQMKEDLHPNDSCYLFEQFGLFLHHSMNQTDDAKIYYYLSFECSIKKITSHSRIAFYELVKILKEEESRDDSNSETAKELHSIYALINRFEEAEGYLKKSGDIDEIIIDLITLFHKQERYGEAYSLVAFLQKHGCYEDHRQLILDVALGAAKHRFEINPNFSMEIYQDTFHSFMDVKVDTPHSEQYDVAVLASRESQQVLTAIELLKQLGLKVFNAIWDSPGSDFPLGHEYFDEHIGLGEKCKRIIIFTDSVRKDQLLTHALKSTLMNQKHADKLRCLCWWKSPPDYLISVPSKSIALSDLPDSNLDVNVDDKMNDLQNQHKHQSREELFKLLISKTSQISLS